ncbi:Ras-related protein Rab-7L1 isoform [Balamuthia mandrillaris]
MRYSPNLMVQLQLWDIAGQARFTNMTRVYYREAVAAFIVFDVTRRSTLDAVAKWRDDLRAIVKLPDGRDIPIVLLANKCDLGGEINAQQMDKFCKENDFIGWFETSAKDNINIEPAMNFMVDSIMRYLPPNSKNFVDSSEESDSDIVSLDESDDPPRNSRCCFT